MQKLVSQKQNASDVDSEIVSDELAERNAHTRGATEMIATIASVGAKLKGDVVLAHVAWDVLKELAEAIREGDTRFEMAVKMMHEALDGCVTQNEGLSMMLADHTEQLKTIQELLEANAVGSDEDLASQMAAAVMAENEGEPTEPEKREGDTDGGD